MKYLILIICLLVSAVSFSQEKSSEADIVVIKKNRLKRLDRRIRDINIKIRDKEIQLLEEDSSAIKEKYYNELQEYKRLNDEHILSFINVVTDINLAKSKGGLKKQQQRTLSQEIQDLLSPLLNTFRELSQKPKRIEKLSEQIRDTKLRLEELRNAKEILEKFAKTGKGYRKQTYTSMKKVKDLIDDYQLGLGKAELAFT